MLIKAMQKLIMLRFWILLILSYNFMTLHLQVKKLIDLLSEMRSFKFVTILFLEFKKIESDDESKNAAFFMWNWKQKQLLMKMGLIMYSNQFILRLYQTNKNFLEKVRVESYYHRS